MLLFVVCNDADFNTVRIPGQAALYALSISPSHTTAVYINVSKIGGVFNSLIQKGQSGVRVDSQVLACWFPIVCQISRPIPLQKKVQQL